MRPHIQKLPLSDRSSFVARTYRTPNFEVGWHKHPEYELILFTEGSGISFVGNHIGRFKTGDMYFLGPNLPHTFQKQCDQVASAVVVQFLDGAFGEGFFSLPESRSIRELLDTSASGLCIHPAMKQELAPQVIRMETQQGMPRLLNLLGCLERIAGALHFDMLSTQLTGNHLSRQDLLIDEVFSYAIAHYNEKISLDEMAKMTCLSVPAFCHYFKKVTKKTFVTFLNEIRVSQATKQLTDTRKSVSEIAYECGFTHPGYFHKQFIRQKGITPLQYRKVMMVTTPQV